ncbi:MAG: mechanosensitive ion channel family protein [Flavobacteriales bacterium]|nr:mechanosensitive ion channel family protein [Flavobacteriales bacterium]MCB9168404.1 mechanosensitive ion channel family protein [Flavobacteriales bacterium]
MERDVSMMERIMAHWEVATLDLVPKLVMAVVLLIAFVLAGRVARAIALRSGPRIFRSNPHLARIFAGMVYAFFVLSGAFIALQVVGLEQVLTKLIAGAGIVGIIAGFAFKDIASNAFAGLLLRFQHPFSTGDWVLIDGTYGTVVELGWLTTSIKTVPGQEVFVPNQIIYNNTFTNFSTYGKLRVILRCGVSYGDDLRHVRTVALQAVKQLPDALPGEDVDLYFTEIGNSTYDFQVRFWIRFNNNNDMQRAMSEAIIAVKEGFAQQGISIAYPVTTLDFGVKGGVNLFDKEVKVGG